MIRLHVVGGPRDGDEIIVPGDVPPADYRFPVLADLPTFHAEGESPEPLNVRQRICPVRKRKWCQSNGSVVRQRWGDYAIDWYAGKEVPL